MGKAKVCSCLVAGIAGCVVLSRIGRGLCDRLITRPEESYCVSNSV
jgi:hypothetical protein